MASGDDIGRLMAQSRRSLATRIAASAIFLVAMTLPYLAWIENVRAGATIAWVIMIALWTWILVGESRRCLAIYENGIIHRRAFGQDIILWHVIEKVVFSFSYSIDPRALFRIDIVAIGGKKYGLDRMALT
jgi:hypothetical protein